MNEDKENRPGREQKMFSFVLWLSPVVVILEQLHVPLLALALPALGLLMSRRLLRQALVKVEANMCSLVHLRQSSLLLACFCLLLRQGANKFIEGGRVFDFELRVIEKVAQVLHTHKDAVTRKVTRRA